jgi:hypothetical protein
MGDKETPVKRMLIAVFAALGLAGCIAVPYHPGPGAGYAYYGPPAPPANVYFRYDYHRHRR